MIKSVKGKFIESINLRIYWHIDPKIQMKVGDLNVSDPSPL